MATSPTVPAVKDLLDQLCDYDFLVPYEPEDDVADPVVRNLYICMTTYKWLQGLKKENQPVLKQSSKIAPGNAMWMRLEEFATHPDFFSGDLVRTMPHKHGVVEVKSPGIRLFGGFVAQNCFVVASHGYKNEIPKKGPNSVDHHNDVVLGFFADHGLTIVKGELHVLLGR